MEDMVNSQKGSVLDSKKLFIIIEYQDSVGRGIILFCSVSHSLSRRQAIISEGLRVVVLAVCSSGIFAIASGKR